MQEWCSVRKGVFRSFVKFTGKRLYPSLFFHKIATLFKLKLWGRCFPVNFAKFRRPTFLQNISGGLRPFGCLTGSRIRLWNYNPSENKSDMELDYSHHKLNVRITS